MRNAAQCVGRVLRGKTDWGLMVFADKVCKKSWKLSVKLSNEGVGFPSGPLILIFFSFESVYTKYRIAFC